MYMYLVSGFSDPRYCETHPSPCLFSDLAVVARSKVDEATLNFTKHQDFDMPTGGVSGDLSTENIVR